MFNRLIPSGIPCVLLLVFLSSGVFCESPVMQDYIQRFVKADIAGKIDLLYEASENSELNAQSGGAAPLYEYGLQFVLDNYAQINELRDMNTIINISVNSLLRQGRAMNIDLLNTLWKLFLEYPDSNTKADIVISLGILGKWNRYIINNLNNYLTEINQVFISGAYVDYTIVSACISAVMELGDSSSYPVLFGIICAGFPEVISFEAYGALEIIPGNLQQFLLNVIENNPPDEKFAAFRAVINSGKLTVPERGQLAEAALAQSLLSGGGNVDLDAMRYASVLVLTNLRWTRANALVIRHYYRVQADFLQDIVPKERFLESIACLGAVGNSDAALVLALQLGLINARMRTTRTFDTEITMEIVQALGLIGDKAAYDHLLTVINLPYTEDIVAEARDAIDRLKW